jgi:transcriptional regulator GlxA family with amidase domain
MVIICADDTMEYYANKSVEAWLRECSRRAIGVGSLGAGTYFLARAGLLANRHCTIHWENLPDFSERFSGSTVSCNLYQIDGNIWTCAGGMASFDMILGLIERDFGERTAAGVCERAVVGRVRGPNERQRLPLSERHGTSNEFLVKAIEQMERHLTEPLPIEEIASRIGRSRRQVERMFRRELNRSPVRYYRELRLERARLLLVQSAMPVVDIAIACGFISASHFSKVYREMNGIAPQDTRRARDVRLPSLLHS